VLEDPRWAKHGAPSITKQRTRLASITIIHHLGRWNAGVVLAMVRCPLSSSNEGIIRKNIIASRLIDCIGPPYRASSSTPTLYPVCYVPARDKKRGSLRGRELQNSQATRPHLHRRSQLGHPDRTACIASSRKRNREASADTYPGGVAAPPDKYQDVPASVGASPLTRSETPARAHARPLCRRPRRSN